MDSRLYNQQIVPGPPISCNPIPVTHCPRCGRKSDHSQGANPPQVGDFLVCGDCGMLRRLNIDLVAVEISADTLREFVRLDPVRFPKLLDACAKLTKLWAGRRVPADRHVPANDGQQRQA